MEERLSQPFNIKQILRYNTTKCSKVAHHKLKIHVKAVSRYLRYTTKKIKT